MQIIDLHDDDLPSSASTHGGLPAFLRNAPADDEPYTEQERAAVEEAYESIRRGEVLPDADATPGGSACTRSS